jgi:hypothetical protein
MRNLARAAILALGLGTLAAERPALLSAQDTPRGQNLKGKKTMPKDPRVGLKPGLYDAGMAARGMELVAAARKPAALEDSAGPGNFMYMNSDLAFRGNYIFQGNFYGFQVWDISTPTSPVIKTVFPCPGGQGDPSVWGNLLFLSVEMPNGRTDCGKEGMQSMQDSVVSARFRGVRIFDISDIEHPKQIAAIQTCRGSHTHTLVTDPNDKDNLYVYVSGTSNVRSPTELAGCSGKSAQEDPNTSLFQVEVIQVPLAAPQEAKVIGVARLFADSAGNPDGLSKAGDHGPGTQTTAPTNMCHDIIVYPAKGLGAGACSGNGILIDIRDAAHPKRIAEVSDPNFAYWHSANFNDAATTILFTDEWGGGMAPRCRATDKPTWGADAIYSLADGKLTQRSFYKPMAPQTDKENCVAHNGSMVPVPGRDIILQGWYQGGLVMVDITDPAKPVEIGFFDRGPVSGEKMLMGGEWAAYWYNGFVVASEIARGLDLLRLKPGPMLSKNEIEAAESARVEQYNPQHQEPFVWPPSFALARAYLDQLTRNKGLAPARIARITTGLARAEKLDGDARRTALEKLAGEAEQAAGQAKDGDRVRKLAAAVSDLAKA